MNTPYKKHTLHSKDTLDTVAQKFNLSIGELKTFHNRYCNLDELIGGEKFPKNLTTIYLPISTGKRNSKIQSIEVTENYIRKPHNKINKTYGVIQKSYENEKLISQIHYQIKIGNNVKENIPYNRVYIRKYKTYLNDQALDMLIDQMYQKLDQMLYPLQLNLKQNGIIHSIENKKELKEKWFSSERTNFIQYYKGNFANKIIAELDDFFNHISAYEEKLFNSMFYPIFFAPFYVNYNNQGQYRQITEFPVLPYQKKTAYLITQKLIQQSTFPNHTLIEVSGTPCASAPYGAEAQPLPGAEAQPLPATDATAPQGNLQLTYKLDNTNKTIFSAEGFITLKITQKLIRKVEIEIYEIK